MNNDKISRRTFVKGAAAALSAAGLTSCGIVPKRHAAISPNDKLNIACIGVGGKGEDDAAQVGETEHVVAVCDVDEDRGAGGFKAFPKAKKYKDYRRMFDEMAGRIDAVTVSTPDHTHFPAAITAMELGKHVFVQKPLTHSVWEARQLRLAAQKYKVATQMGNQGHANEGTRLVREWVQSGLIGEVREVHIWTNRPAGMWAQGVERPTETQAIPSTLDWDLWLGTAPYRPYNSIYLPFTWRGWWDFGCGSLGDMGCHIMDAAFWALDLGSPTSVEAESSPVNNETAPSWSIVTYRFPARGNMPPVKLVWSDGGKIPDRPADLEPEREMPGGGQIIYGSKAVIMDTTDYCESPRIIPETKMQELKSSLPAKTIPRIPRGNHYQEWIKACKGGTPAGSDFEHAGPLTEMVLLGNVAIRIGRKIEWDGPNMKAKNLPEADQYIRHGYRQGWDIV